LGHLEEGPGERYALTLTARQLHSSFPDKRVVSIGQIRNELVRVSPLSPPHKPRRWSRPACELMFWVIVVEKSTVS